MLRWQWHILLTSLITMCLYAYESDAADCTELYQALANADVSEELQRFHQELEKKSSASHNDLVSFLQGEGVNLEQTSLHPDHPIVISPFGQHPLNRLAQVYSLDQIIVAFFPKKLLERKLKGAYVSSSKMILLESTRTGRFAENVLTITDLHELLHARVAKHAAGSYLASWIYNAHMLYPPVLQSPYGHRLSLSELLTWRQDLRLILGKLKLWFQEQDLKPANLRERWLRYFWPRQSHNRGFIELGEDLIKRAQAKVRALQSMNNILGEVIKHLDQAALAWSLHNQKPANLTLRHLMVAGERRPFLAYELREMHDPDLSPRFLFSLNVQLNDFNWQLAQQEIMEQIRQLRQRYEEANAQIAVMKNKLNEIEYAWAKSEQTTTSPQLGLAIKRAHEHAKIMHHTFYQDLAAHRAQTRP